MNKCLSWLQLFLSSLLLMSLSWLSFFAVVMTILIIINITIVFIILIIIRQGVGFGDHDHTRQGGEGSAGGDTTLLGLFFFFNGPNLVVWLY